MTDIIFLSVAFGERYIEQQKRLDRSIAAIYPSGQNVNSGETISCYHFGRANNYPVLSKQHNESLYGFKVYAIKEALKHYKKIIWLDTACILQQPVDYWFSLNAPVLAAKDDNALSKCIGEKALKYYGTPDITGMHLVGGSVYVFDFNHPDCQKIFDHWARAEAAGMFGSQQEQASGKINKHRHDESCMSMALYQNGYEPIPCDVMKYNQGQGSIIIKDHFK